MEGQLFDEAALRLKSKEEAVPFENLIARIVLEEILRKIYGSEYADIFLLKNSVEIINGGCKNRAGRTVSFCMWETKNFLYKKSEIGCIFAKLFQNIKKDSVYWNYSITEVKQKNISGKPGAGSGFLANMTATVFSIQVPVEIRMEKCGEDCGACVEKEIALLAAVKEEKLKINCYPGEAAAAEKFLNIIYKLELISDLSDYMQLYQILRSEILSGRKMSELLIDGCKTYGIEIKQKRMDILLSYEKNSYMIKKWKLYLRHEKLKEPDWKDIMETIESFFKIIWDSLCQNVIYLGDWMPELGRFID